ncbi:MAG: YbjN domain-containing protein [Aureispira sp.]|nr:YbjN domain-containing protein [Aureispira sp.]
MANLEVYIPIIESAIQKMGVSPETTRTDTPFQWSLHRGSASVAIFMRESPSHKGPRNVLIIGSPIMKLPKDPLQAASLYRYLLELSHSALIEAFSIYDDHVYLKTSRFVDGMDSDEVVDMLDSLSYSADFIDDQLKKRFDVNDINALDDDTDGSRT